MKVNYFRDIISGPVAAMLELNIGCLEINKF